MNIILCYCVHTTNEELMNIILCYCVHTTNEELMNIILCYCVHTTNEELMNIILCYCVHTTNEELMNIILCYCVHTTNEELMNIILCYCVHTTNEELMNIILCYCVHTTNEELMNIILCYCVHTTNEELMNIILLLHENKSSRPSSIPVKLLKITVIIVPLCELINHFFDTGIFPDAIKISKVIPIYKAGSSQDVNNYRPISLLSIFSKIMETIIHIRLYNFLEHHKVIFQSQFGFQKINPLCAPLSRYLKK